MVRMIRPDGGVCYVLETRVDEYRAMGFRVAEPARAKRGSLVSTVDTREEKKPLKPLRKRKGLEITQ